MKAKTLLLLICIAFLLLGLVIGLGIGKIPVKRESEPTTIEVMVVEKLVAPDPFYELTEDDRIIVEQVVMAEASGECYAGQMAVAQCILNACIRDDITPTEAVVKYKYAPTRPEPSESVKKAVDAVFTLGQKAAQVEILWFYAPARCTSTWHESQKYVCTIGGHKFFMEG